MQYRADTVADRLAGAVGCAACWAGVAGLVLCGTRWAAADSEPPLPVIPDARHPRSVALPGSADGAVDDENQALEVFLAPEDFPDTFLRLVQEGVDAESALNLERPGWRGEVLPNRVRWPLVGGRPLVVLAPAERLELVALEQGPERPSQAPGGAAQSGELRLEWYLEPMGARAEGVVGRVQEVRVTWQGHPTAMKWEATAPGDRCNLSAAPGRPRCRLDGLGHDVRAVAVSPSGQWVAVTAGENRHRVDLLDGATWRVVRRFFFSPRRKAPAFVGFAAGGSHLVVVDQGGGWHRWDAATGGGYVRRHLRLRPRSLAVVDAGRLLVGRDRIGRVGWRAAADGTPVGRPTPGEGGPWERLAVSENGWRCAALSSDDGGDRITVWALESEEVVERLRVPGGGIRGLALDVTGDTLLAAHGSEGLWRRQVRARGQAWQRWGGPEGCLCRGALSMGPQGNLLACVAVGGGVLLFDGNTGEYLRRLETGSADDRVGSLLFSPDGRKLLAVTQGSLLEWAVAE